MTRPYDLKPHQYTGGRYLRNDKAQLKARQISFDFGALCRRVQTLCPDDISINFCGKREGGFNRVFIFQTDSGKLLVAKLPFSLAGPQRWMTHSEVATMKFLQQRSEIPIPRILDWSDDPLNDIGSEYIIMEHADGVQLDEVWPFMSANQRIECIQNIYQNLGQINNIGFPAYGSLYTAAAPLQSSSRVTMNDGYCIGPHCGTRYWDCDSSSGRYFHLIKPNQGPWTDLKSWSDGLIDTGISRLPPTENVSSDRPGYLGSVESHLEILNSGRSLLKSLAEDDEIGSVAKPTLFHPDLNKRNIFVSKDDPTVVKAFIDWQSASFEPAFWYVSQTPDFGQLPDKEAGAVNPNMGIYGQAVEASIKYHLPEIGRAQEMDINIFRPFFYSHRTWYDGIVALEHEMIEISRSWSDLGLKGRCPISTAHNSGTAAHEQRYLRFVAAQKLQSQLAGLLDTGADGWVSTEDWDAKDSEQKALFQDLLQRISRTDDAMMDEDDPIKTEEDLREIWPFDL